VSFILSKDFQQGESLNLQVTLATDLFLDTWLYQYLAKGLAMFQVSTTFCKEDGYSVFVNQGCPGYSFSLIYKLQTI
jgi:hypothetical protein